jgi:ribosomal protein S4E
VQSISTTLSPKWLTISSNCALATNGLSSTRISVWLRVLVQHVLEVAEARLEAHHPVFAQAVDGRVRHLAEVLPEDSG